jgi:hypothetical protein
MTTGATGQLGLALPVQGELSGTWGDTVNNGITQYTNIAIAGTLTLTGDGAVTLANTTGDASASNITSTLAGAGTVTAQFSTIRVSGTTTTKVVTGPSYSKSYLIDNASSYTVTFKASGQTGVSISPSEKVYVYYNATDYVKVGGGGITYGAVKTTTYTAVANDGVLTNTTSAAFTVNLPATPSTGTQVFIADSAGTWATNNLTIGRNGSTIAGSATDLVCDINSVSIQCIYDGTTWDIFAQIGANDTAVVTLNGTQTLTNKTLTSPTITSPTVTGTGTIAAATVTLSSTLAVTGVSTLTGGAVIQGLTVGRGGGAVATNTAAGSGALATNSSGDQNTALGYQALNLNSTSGNSTGIGYLALSASTAGSNSALGARSLQQNTSGASNSSFGAVALYSNLTGSFNSAFGADALRNNTASNNTAVGYRALYTNTTGSGLTAVGGFAGNSHESGANSTYVGYTAGIQTSTGASNTFLGAEAGYYVSSGSKNTIVGRFDGNLGGLDIRTASNYVVLSDGDGNPLISTANSQTVALKGAIPNSGTGITFPATQSASSNANTLDDYEEGTWSPSIGGSTTYSYQDGYYTKCGNVVTVSGRMQINSQAGNANTYQITNLPFTSKNTSNGSKAGGGVVPVASGTAISVTSLQTYVDGNSTNMVFCCYTAAATSNSTATIFTNSTDVYFTATYLTA